jgi:hypothetical protein
MTASREAAKTDDIVVFQILRDSACAECGEELGKGRWLRLERERPLCLSCADLAHLVFLPTGDAALTRRAGRYSSLKAVLVRFSRARKRRAEREEHLDTHDYVGYSPRAGTGTRLALTSVLQSSK